MSRVSVSLSFPSSRKVKWLRCHLLSVMWCKLPSSCAQLLAADACQQRRATKKTTKRCCPLSGLKNTLIWTQLQQQEHKSFSFKCFSNAVKAPLDYSSAVFECRRRRSAEAPPDSRERRVKLIGYSKLSVRERVWSVTDLRPRCNAAVGPGQAGEKVAASSSPWAKTEKWWRIINELSIHSSLLHLFGKHRDIQYKYLD